MALAVNAVSGVTISLPEWLDGRVLAEGQIVYVRGLAALRIGDGVTVGGLPVGTGGGEGGDAIAFKVIAVEGVDPAQWPIAEQVGDTLTLRPLRGITVSPIPGSDTISIGFPDGGAFGNGLFWTGTAFAPSPPPVAEYEPQEGEISTDLLLEGARKLSDGYVELSVYLPATNPAGVVTNNGISRPVFGATASGLARAVGRVPDALYSGMSVVIRLKTAATSGAGRFTAKIGVLADPAVEPTFGAAALLTETVPAGATQFDVEIPLVELSGVVGGSQFAIEFGRLGADAADTAAADIIMTDVWLRLL